MPPKAAPAPIRACLFDMDGLLINSEDLYTIATNEALLHFDPGHEPLPWPIKAQLQGRPAPQATEIFMAWANIPVSIADFHKHTATLQEKYFPRTEVLPGVQELVEKLAGNGVRIALATSSTTRNFELKTAHLGKLFDLFPPRQRVLGDDRRVKAGRGKPAPDIFLVALQTINEELKGKGEKLITPDECLVFEDSVPGVEAGRRAGMQVVWCPHPGLLGEFKDQQELVLAGLTGEHKGGDASPEPNELIPQGTRSIGTPGDIDDGWATLLGTLENFPYARYSIGEKSAL
ncbi:putative HAD superfamily hydrolase [Pseudovirgaria hyperparasitica]|uniref:HAD superfamily hydrolase n=1 Tax=Pseudovirgaria hyperparasitica TaxID=470096 RepID=A0A6A6WGT2_9PEZI|nr:putative HAD superfamily hydrolase [Pseudovirgaria hyperparasitica]KAF2762003.1 putative HAD superfamily hydrolase [Pseudovirgaria hyperparasitica]